MTSLRLLFAAAAVTTLFSACGGGGSEAGSAPPPVASVAITSSNQQGIARAALDGGLALTRSQVLRAEGRTSTFSAPAAGAAVVGLPDLARGAVLSATRQALAQLFPDFRRARADARARPTDVITNTESCSLGGTATSAFNDRDNNGASANDTLTLTFNQCRMSANDSISGAFVFTVGSVMSATASRVEFSGSMSYQGVSTTFGPTTTSVNGSVSVDFLSTDMVSQLNLTIGASGLSASVSAPQYNDTIHYEPGLRIESVESLATPASSTVSVDGSFSSTAIGGRITVATAQAVTQLHSDSTPSAGQIHVVGASSSALRITVLDATRVRIELDAGGDGHYEASTELAWSTLMPG